MSNQKTEESLSATKIGKQIGFSGPKVKKAIAQLGLEPARVRCGCSYYAVEDIPKIKKAIAG